jgi:hypothetical protein
MPKQPKTNISTPKKKLQLRKSSITTNTDIFSPTLSHTKKQGLNPTIGIQPHFMFFIQI